MLLFFRNIEKTEDSQILTALDFEPNTKIPSPWHNRWIALSQKPRLSLCFLCTTSSATAHKQVTQLHWPYWRSCWRKYGFSVSLEIFGSWIIMESFRPSLTSIHFYFLGSSAGSVSMSNWFHEALHLALDETHQTPRGLGAVVTIRRHGFTGHQHRLEKQDRFFVTSTAGKKPGWKARCCVEDLQNWWLLMPMPWSF